MERATRWLRGFLGMKKDRENAIDGVLTAVSGNKREKKRWSFSKPSTEPSSHPLFAYARPIVPARHSGAGDSLWLGLRAVDVEKGKEEEEEQQQSRRANAIAVAAATAAAADAAVAAAEAAVAVVRLTTGHGGSALSGFGKEAYAAVKIQRVFRGFLARKALRALRGIVKLQALARGYLVRKRAATTLGLMQSLFRAQSMVRCQRARCSIEKENQNPMENRPRRSTESEFHSKRLSGSLDIPVDDSTKTVEIDPAMARCRSRRISSSPLSESRERIPYSSPLPCPVSDRVFTPDRGQKPDLEWCLVGNDYECRFSSTSHSTAGLPSPARRACLAAGVGDRLLRPCSGVPSYMANTRSSRAKSRSQSAPKQRSEEGSKKRLSLSEVMASRKSISGVRMDRSFSQLEEILE